MVLAFAVILSFVCLYFSQKKLITIFGRLIHRFGGNRNSLIIFWSLIFLPGTVIHELSHFLFAILTGARTGKIEILPKILEAGFEKEVEGSGVALGSVQTQRLNLIQGTLVGLAPFFVGLSILVWLTFSLQASYLSSSYYWLFFQGYLFFTISNSFFPSSSDLRHVVPAAVMLLFLLLLSWVLGFKFVFTTTPLITSSLKTVLLTISVSVTLNLVISLILSPFKR